MQQEARKSDGKREGRPQYGRGPRAHGGRMDRDPRKRRRKPCFFCAQKLPVDYKDNDIMRKFVTERGKIMTQRASGCCAKHQRALAIQIKRARQVGLLPYTAE